MLAGCMLSLHTLAVDGETVFMKNCRPCHQSSAYKAPQLEKKQDWQVRISAGKDAMLKNTLKGFQGKFGFMPARGGNPDLTDEDLAAAIDYIIAKTKD